MVENLIKEVRHPHIENSDIRLREICNNRAKELYGENIPEKIAKRIEWEISAIYKMEISFVFILLKELMAKNNLTGADIMMRGFSGGSLVMYLCGITNYNPMEFELTPYFTFGLEKDKWNDIELNVPSSLEEQINSSCKIPEGIDYYTADKKMHKLKFIPHEEVELAYNLSRRLDIDSKQIKLNDTDILSLFSSPNALGITSDDIEGVKYGVLGLPGFKFSLPMDMLDYIKINSFDDFIKLQGMLHGTDTWFGNAKNLLREGKKLCDTIATREDVFEYLLMKGLSKKDAYRITEQVRKGKGVSTDDEKLMKVNDVPEWYINSCDKIRYLFTRTHCISYAMNFWKLAYIKIHYPKEFYEEYFKVYKFDGLNEAISNGYEAFLEYVNNREKEYEPMEDNEEYHDNYLREEHCVLVAKEMFARERSLI